MTHGRPPLLLSAYMPVELPSEVEIQPLALDDPMLPEVRAHHTTPNMLLHTT